MPDPKVWTKLARVAGDSGGAHAYIKGDVLKFALREAGIPEDSRNLEMKAVYLGECANRVASLCVMIREKGVKELKQQVAVTKEELGALSDMIAKAEYEKAQGFIAGKAASCEIVLVHVGYKR